MPVKWPSTWSHTSWASYQIRKIAGCACAGNAGNVFPCRRFQIKPLVSDPGMHHGTCVTHVPWCMSGSLTCGDRENVPGIPGACAPAILRIWQEAHATNPETFLSHVISYVYKSMYCWYRNDSKKCVSSILVNWCHFVQSGFTLHNVLYMINITSLKPNSVS